MDTGFYHRDADAEKRFSVFRFPFSVIRHWRLQYQAAFTRFLLLPQALTFGYVGISGLTR
jgi:hypothetical protein